jgi:hypothetical protein
MRVQRVLMPDGSESWTVLDVSGEPVPAVEALLAHLQALDRSPTTVRTYATSLKLWLQFLDGLGVGVDQVTVEHVSRFVAWLRTPADNVTVLAGGSGRCGPATANKHLAALFSFYDSVPLDPTTWSVLERCLAHRQSQRTQNPHLVVTRGTKAGTPARLDRLLQPPVGPCRGPATNRAVHPAGRPGQHHRPQTRRRGISA